MRRPAISPLSEGDNNDAQRLLSPVTALLLPNGVPRRGRVHLTLGKMADRISL